MKKQILCAASIVMCAAAFTSCSGTFNAAGASELTITANGSTVQITSADGNKDYDALVQACSGTVHNGKLDDCHFGDVVLTFDIGGEDIVLYPCTDENCKYIAMGDISGEKYDYIKMNSDERTALFDFVNEYTY